MSATTATTRMPRHPAFRAMVRLAGFDKHIVTLLPAVSASSAIESLAGLANDLNGKVTSHMILGGARAAASDATGDSPPPWPLTWLQGDPCGGGHPADSQAVVISGTDVRPLVLHGRRVGAWYEDADARYCQLDGILPTNATASRAAQAREFFENMESALAQAGMEFRDLVRTWLYLDHLLEWYYEFNTVRTQFFDERGVFERLVPASTGIGAGNHRGMALTGAALAVKPKTSRVRVTPVASPLQCPALDYKSSFSRAVEITSPDCRELLISGTASIQPDGRSAHRGDAARQIDLTLRVVAAILESRDMDWPDTTRAIAYFKDLRDTALFHTRCRETGIPPLPAALMHADICRDDLLFEIEIDAARPRAPDGDSARNG